MEILATAYGFVWGLLHQLTYIALDRGGCNSGVRQIATPTSHASWAMGPSARYHGVLVSPLGERTHMFKQLAHCTLGLAMLTTTAIAHAQDVRLTTSMGDIVITLDAAKAPKSVENFLAYVNDKFYDGTIFHRVIDGFMIQGGGFTPEFDRKPTRDPIQNEADNGLANARGTIAMARTNDPHSATSQFFINVADNDNLNQPSGGGWGYAVFGSVTEGMDVVDKIRQVATGRQGPYGDVPSETITIMSATVEGQ